jgi:hypothetical protein
VLETEPETDTGAPIRIAISAIIAVGPIAVASVASVAVTPIAVVSVVVVSIATVSIAAALVVAIPRLLNDTGVSFTVLDGR